MKCALKLLFQSICAKQGPVDGPSNNAIKGPITSKKEMAKSNFVSLVS